LYFTGVNRQLVNKYASDGDGSKIVDYIGKMTNPDKIKNKSKSNKVIKLMGDKVCCYSN
jgi:hypothetical protein